MSRYLYRDKKGEHRCILKDCHARSCDGCEFHIIRDPYLADLHDVYGE